VRRSTLRYHDAGLDYIT